MSRVRTVLRRYPIWAVLVALVVGAGIGVAGESSNVSELEDQVATLEEEVGATEDELAGVQETLARQRAKGNTVASERRRLIKLERRLEKRAAALDHTEEAQRAAEFEDGIWEVGTDIEPGTYRAEGGPGCYWALLGSADTADIVNNGGFGPNQTITIDSAWFETSNCGTWEKIDG